MAVPDLEVRHAARSVRHPVLPVAAAAQMRQAGGVKAEHRSSPHPLFDGVAYEYGAVVARGAIVFTAGACPLDEAGELVAPGDHAAQAVAALGNLRAALARYRAGVEHLVRTTIYVVGDHEALMRVWGVIADGLAPQRPPSTLLGVSLLGYRGQLVEIDGIAALPS